MPFDWAVWKQQLTLSEVPLIKFLLFIISILGLFVVFLTIGKL